MPSKKKAATKKVAKKVVKSAVKKAAKKSPPKKSGGAAAPVVAVWEHDPASGNKPDGSVPIQVAPPNTSATSLPTIIINPAAAPAVGVFAPGTPEFRYWTAAAALARGSAFWSALLPGVKWQAGKLLVNLDAGVDLNAFYNRTSLTFFHKAVGNRTVFSCESPDVVCHEQGHAVLDALKPQLWNAASIEAAAFHESLGDISAILCALQLPTMRQAVLVETGGSLFRSSKLSRVAEQLGWGIRQSRPDAVDPDCLRNAVNAFFYRDPNTLPSSAPASSLSSAPHSFSRVFTSAFMEGLANMFKVRPQQNEQQLLQVSIDMGKILVKGIRNASVVPGFYSQVAVNMIQAANTDFPALRYAEVLRLAFIKHGIITPGASSAFVGMAAFADAAPAAATSELTTTRLSVAEYGLGMDSILVHSASEPKRFDVAGAAPAFGPVSPSSADEAAKAFVEDLLRRGRLKVEDSGMAAAGLAGIAPPADTTTHEKNTHVLRKYNDEYILERVRIDCCFCDHDDC